MRAHRTFGIVVFLALLATGVAACGGAEQAAQVAPLAESSAATVSGTVNKLDRSALPENAVIEVELLQMSAAGGADTVLATQTIAASGQQLPIPFAMPYDPAQVDATQTYLIGARVTVDGQVIYASQTATAVVTNGAPTSGIEILVGPQAEATAGALSGTVTYLERIAMEPAAVIEVELQDVSTGTPAVVATTQVAAEGRQVPIPFTLTYDPAAINAAGTYLLYGRILVNGTIAFASASGVPVLTNGAPAGGVELLLSPVAAPGQGGMIQGTVTTPRPPAALEPDAVLRVELRAPMLADAPATAVADVPLGGVNFPVSFALPYDPGSIAADRAYVVAARVIAGNRLLYVSLAPVPALTNGAPASNITVPVAAVPDPAGGVLRFTATAADGGAASWPANSAAYLAVEIRETNLAGAPALASAAAPLAGLSLPVAWELGYDAATLDPNRDYILDARIIDNNALTLAAAPAPVLTKGAPANDVTIALSPQGTGGGDSLLSGQLTADGAAPLDPAASIQVEIRETNLAGAPALVSISFAAEGRQFPIAFEAPYNAGQIDPNKDYVVDARIIGDNRLLYQAAAPVAVITKGALASGVTVPMTPGPTDAPPGGTITGVITTGAPAALDAAAVYYIDLREAGTTGEPLVTISSALNGQQFPIPFEVPYNPAQIDANKDYVLGARILLGDRVLYASAVGVPVITKGAPVANVTVSIPAQ